MENIPSSPGPVNEEAARQQVAGPAIFLMVVGGLWAASSLWNLVQLMVSSQKLPPQIYDDPNLAPVLPYLEKYMEVSTGPAGYLTIALSLAMGALVLVGGLKMKNLESRGLAMAGSIIALLPCSCCCVLGLPAGIWSLVVLSKPEIKAAFRG